MTFQEVATQQTVAGVKLKSFKAKFPLFLSNLLVIFF